MTSDQYPVLDARLATRGWIYDRGDEVYKDRDGNVIDAQKVRLLVPPGMSWDDLAAWEYWKIHRPVH